MVGIKIRIWAVSITVLLLGSTSHADVLFEGYSKITSGGVHVGYVITRYEFNPKEKRFYGTYFLKTGELGSDVTESVKSVADIDFNPISYEYTSIVGKTTKTIDAKFKKNRMTAVVKEGEKTKTIQKDLPKGTFLSNFLIYLMLKSKDGLKTESNYNYSAIAEEDADVMKGEALVGKQEKFNGQMAYKILNKFKNVKFVSYVSDRGEVLGTSSPANGIGTELVARPQDAVGHFGTSTSILKLLFGEVPLGTDNVISRANKNEALRQTAPTPDKQQGVPGGQGIQIKGTLAPPTKQPGQPSTGKTE